MLALKRTDSDNPVFQQLVALLDQDLAIRDGDDHAFYASFNGLTNIHHCVIAYLNEEAVGCGALRPYGSDGVEIKRMFVSPAFRGQGIAGVILSALETWALELGFDQSVLETGKKQPEAIRLYQKSGYRIIPNYGQYAGVENSVCMEKKLGLVI